MIWVWLVALIALVAVEALTLAFVAIFVALGALAGVISSLAGAPIWLQVVLFGVVAIAGVVAIRPFLLRFRASKAGNTSIPGVQTLPGQRALTLDEVGDSLHPGHVQLAGEKWLACVTSGDAISANTGVIVDEVRGTMLVVRLAE